MRRSRHRVIWRAENPCRCRELLNRRRAVSAGCRLGQIAADAMHQDYIGQSLVVHMIV